MEDLLEEKGWTKAEFAKRLGCSTKHVSQLLSGKVPLTDDLATATTLEYWDRLQDFMERSRS